MTNSNSKKSVKKQPPVDYIRVGNVQASIWERPTEARTFFDVTFQRSFRDANGYWKNSQSFDLQSLLALQHIIGLAIGRVLALQTGRVGSAR